ncbi:putative tRNA-splicing endonuclease subunit sen54 [Yarrowia sp. B02]|nr:putative tRNA-splicing endonuclease subunit sen54 [Yarrowia sp. B02]
MDDDIDLADEQQDWSFLDAISGVKAVESAQTLPKRGEKDFEQDATEYQQKVLQSSLNAMYGALEGERRHAAKSHVRAVWFDELQKAQVDVARGPHFKTIGTSDSAGKVWLYPEEAIYLLERGSMELYWPNGVQISLQGAYAVCAGKMGDDGIDRVHTYSHLKRAGFVVQRASQAVTEPVVREKTKMSFSWIYRFNVHNIPFLWSHPKQLIYGVYNDRDQIYRDLQLVQAYRHGGDKICDSESSENPFKVTYYVWKPRAADFKKSNPPPPDFKIVVVNTERQKMPTLEQTEQLFDEAVRRHPNGDLDQRHIMQKLKFGKREIILAMLDYGVINFVTLADVSFASNPLYEDKPRPRVNRGGRGGRGGKRGGKR